MYHNIYFHQVEVSQYSVFQYPPYDLALANKMAEVTERENLDILHVHYAIPMLYVRSSANRWQEKT